MLSTVLLVALFQCDVSAERRKESRDEVVLDGDDVIRTVSERLNFARKPPLFFCLPFTFFGCSLILCTLMY